MTCRGCLWGDCECLVRETTMLTLARIDHTLPYHSGTIGFGCSLAAQLAKLHRRHVDVNIDPIQQWSRDLSHVTLDLIW